MKMWLIKPETQDIVVSLLHGQNALKICKKNAKNPLTIGKSHYIITSLSLWQQNAISD